MVIHKHNYTDVSETIINFIALIDTVISKSKYPYFFDIQNKEKIKEH